MYLWKLNNLRITQKRCNFLDDWVDVFFEIFLAHHLFNSIDYTTEIVFRQVTQQITDNAVEQPTANSKTAKQPTVVRGSRYRRCLMVEYEKRKQLGPVLWKLSSVVCGDCRPFKLKAMQSGPNR